jgi:hypothetical protein
MEKVSAALAIQDATGQSATDRLVVGPPEVSGIQDIAGSGVLAPGATCRAVWTILPSRDAAPTDPVQYLVSGVLSYSEAGVAITIPLSAVPILVKPDPLLVLRYFWQRDVYSDDPFTEEVEPAEPFSVGLLVSNLGYGTAQNMTIASAQPKIVDNEKGLLVAFKIIGSQVNANPVSPSLTVNLGDIAPQSTTAARWLMTSSIQGKFIEYKASFEHKDGLGNPRTSLIDSVEIHELDHVVRVDVPDDDSKPDFLCNDVPDNADLPDAVCISDNTRYGVTPVPDPAVSNAITPGHFEAILTGQAPSGFVYYRTEDPSRGKWKLLRVIRSDGKEIRLDDNAWTTHRTIRLAGQAPYKQHRLHIFDYGSTGSYRLIYGDFEARDASCGAAKLLEDGRLVKANTAVTAIFADCMYIESTDRSAGIRVAPPSGAVGDVVLATGAMRTNADGERYIDASTVTKLGSASVEPLGVMIRTLYGGPFGYDPETGAGQKGMARGVGLNVTGLLVRLIGRVTGSASGAFLMDDGAGAPVEVRLPQGMTVPAVGAFVRVTGIVTMEATDGPRPVILVRGPADLLPNIGPSLARTIASPPGALGAGYNLFSLPGIPGDPSPPEVLANFDPGTGYGLSGRLSRFDAGLQQTVFWHMPEGVSVFGNMLLGDAYWFRADPGEHTTISFDGLPFSDQTDALISVPKIGLTQMGHPFLFPVEWRSVQVTDGTRTLPLAQAAWMETPPWVSSVAQYYDTQSQSARKLGLPDDLPDSTLLMPWRGYWVTSSRIHLGLIIPSSAVTPIITGLNPAEAEPGGPEFMLNVNGDGYVGGSTVLWNGQPRDTTYVSSTELAAAVPATDIAQPGASTVRVANPAPGAAVSDGFVFRHGGVLTDVWITVDDVTVQSGQTAGLTAHLRRTSDQAGVGSRRIDFSVDGSYVGAGWTDNAGLATTPYKPPSTMPGGDHTLRADFAGDTEYKPAFGIGRLTINTTLYETVMKIATTQNWRLLQKGIVVARLRRLEGDQPLPDRLLTASISGITLAASKTNALSSANLSFAPTEQVGAGKRTLRVEFAGDDANQACIATASITIQRMASLLTIAPASGSPGRASKLSAKLIDAGPKTAAVGKTVTFLVDGKPIGSAITDKTGTAALSYLVPGSLALGAHKLTGVFDGDTNRMPAAGSSTLTVRK